MKSVVRVVVTRENGDPIPEGTPDELLIKPGGVQTLAYHGDYLRELDVAAKAG